MPQNIPVTQFNGFSGYSLGMDKYRAVAKVGTVVQTPDGQWWEVTAIKPWRNNSITTEYLAMGKKVSAKYAALSSQIQSLKADYLKAKTDSKFGPAAYDFEAGQPARDRMAQIKAELAQFDQARVAKVMPTVQI